MIEPTRRRRILGLVPVFDGVRRGLGGVGGFGGGDFGGGGFGIGHGWRGEFKRVGVDRVFHNRAGAAEDQQVAIDGLGAGEAVAFFGGEGFGAQELPAFVRLGVHKGLNRMGKPRLGALDPLALEAPAGGGDDLVFILRHGAFPRFVPKRCSRARARFPAAG